MVSEQEIREIALGLPGAYEQETYGRQPSWRTTPRMFAWIRTDPDALVVWVDSVEDKAALIDAEPAKFLTTSHNDGHPVVLARLGQIDRDEAAELVTDSWRLRAPRGLVKAWGRDHGRTREDTA